MKVVVTGALGHIGSQLIRMLPNYFVDCEIVMIDNLVTQRYSSLFKLPNSGRYRFIEGDVASMELESVFKGANAVVQLAAITDATSSFDRAEEVERINYTATEKVANACLKVGVPLIMASSTSVYGTQERQVDEDCSPAELKPQSPYAETKLKEEELVIRKHNDGLKVIIFRFGTIVGVSPGMRFHTAVNKFCWQSVMGTPLTVWKTAYDQKRPYLNLNDCIRAIIFSIENELFDGRVYNVVTKNATVRDVVDVIRVSYPRLQLNFVEHRIMNQLSYEVLNTRISRAGFKVGGDFSECINDTIAMLKQANSELWLNEN